ncbi:MAG: DUF4862 family protein [Rhodoglobus sp.]
MTTPFLVSAYAASPAHTQWDPELEAELLPSLCALPDVEGLEVPWLGALHPHDPSWFLRNIPAGAQLSLTPLPWVMKRSAMISRYGLASPDAEGRTAALTDLRLVAADARRIAEESSATVAFVTLHTAPRGGGNVDALARSIDEVSRWDWADARLVIEHCDAAIAGQDYEKGFLPIEQEIAAIDATGAPIGMWLNWGRSAVELRDSAAVTAQIAGAAQSGLLTGLTFSGASAHDGTYGQAWADAHLPILSTDVSSHSALDCDAVDASLFAAADVPWLGIKVSRRPDDTSAQDVVRTVAANLDAVRHRHLRKHGSSRT